MEGNVSVFTSLKSKKKKAPIGVSFLATFLYFLEAVVTIVLIVLVVCKHRDAILLAAMFIGIIILLLAINYSFEWFINGKIVFSDKYITYTFDDVVAVVGKSTVTEQITSISNISISHNKIVIYGDILHIEPLRGKSRRTKCELLGKFEDEELLIKKLNDFMEVSNVRV